MTNKKKIILSIITLVFVAIAGIFGFVIANKQDLNVKADTNTSAYTFSSSILLNPTCRFSSKNTSNVNTNYNVYISFNAFIHYLFSNSSTFEYDVNGYVSGFSTSSGANKVLSFGSETRFSPTTSWQSMWCPVGNNAWYVLFNYKVTSLNFMNSSSVYKIVVMNDTSQYAFGGSFYAVTYDFYDLDNNVFTLQFPYYHSTTYTDGYQYTIPARTIYLLNTDNLSSNEYYNAGYNNGYNVGTNDGYTDGYSAGTSAGYDNAYSAGYNDGVSSANNYSFLGLIGAAFDVPLNAFKSCFDFNVLGVNMKDFFFAILSFTLILFVVRLILGGK